MKVEEVIEARAWVNKRTGGLASIYGAVPWTSDAEAHEWELVVRGYTWRMSNGTVGLGRPVAATREEALAVMDRFNNRRYHA